MVSVAVKKVRRGGGGGLGVVVVEDRAQEGSMSVQLVGRGVYSW